MLSTRFLILLSLFVARQIPHLHLEVRNRHLQVRYTGDKLGAWVFYAVYCGVSGVSAYCIWRGGQPSGMFAAGVVVLVSGIALRLLALRELNGFYSATIAIRTNHKLIRKGVYAVIRHPLHLALLAELLGMIVMAGSVPMCIGWAGFCIIVVCRNRREDSVLERYLTAEAVAYQRDVPAMNLVAGLLRLWRTGRRSFAVTNTDAHSTLARRD